ncbi:hypothetical protein NDU88_005456 [Pleurodeles waltl]|uniref:Uncharacterized protein n=1 Tax=Pleurodeles waltl TaxID=8319 RepID=A0AAV7TWN0_PLEWA|nr:hypothetical protein NDU88_005456 [Pleurodeles waltl]
MLFVPSPQRASVSFRIAKAEFPECFQSLTGISQVPVSMFPTEGCARVKNNEQRDKSFRSTLGSIAQAGTLSGGRTRRKRRTARSRRERQRPSESLPDSGRLLGRQPPEAAHERRRRPDLRDPRTGEPGRRRNQHPGDAVGRAWPSQVRSHSGKVCVVKGRREVGDGRYEEEYKRGGK